MKNLRESEACRNVIRILQVNEKSTNQQAQVLYVIGSEKTTLVARVVLL